MFEKNIKEPTFKKRVADQQARGEPARGKQNEIKQNVTTTKWEYAGRSTAKKGKKKNRISAFSTNVSNHIYPDYYFLLDSAASVHVFQNKARFSNFKMASRRVRLLCGQNIVKIEGWGNVSLSLKVENWILLLILKNATYISNFPLNLVLLSCLKDQGLSWSHETGENCNSSLKIIGYTVCNGNNYKIGDSDSISGMSLTLMTLIMTLRRSFVHRKGKTNKYLHQAPTKSNDKHQSSDNFSAKHRQHHELYAPASTDTWHKRMGHIGPHGFYKLGKKCLGIQLHGKTMSQCPHCALSKIIQQISRRPPANKSTRPFHQVFIDWLDFKEGCDMY